MPFSPPLASKPLNNQRRRTPDSTGSNAPTSTSTSASTAWQQLTGRGSQAPITPGGQSFADALNVLNAYNAPTMTGLQISAQNAQQQAAIQQAMLGAQQASAQQGYQLAQQQNHLDQQAIGVDLAAANRQIGYYGDQQAIEDARYQASRGYLAGQQQVADWRYGLAGDNRELDQRLYALAGDRYGLAGQDYDIAGQRYGLAGERYGLQGQTHESVLAQLANQVKMAERDRFQANRDAASRATGAGAFTSAGHRWDRSDNYAAEGFRKADLAEQVNQENINREQQGVDYRGAGLDYASAGVDYSRAGLDYQQAGIADDRSELDYRGAGIDYMDETATLAHQGDELGFDLQSGRLTTAEQQARLEDRIQTLNNQAAQLGVSAQQLTQQLNAQIQQLGLQGQLNAGQLMDMLNSNSIQQQQLANQIVMQALGYGATSRPAMTDTTTAAQAWNSIARQRQK